MILDEIGTLLQDNGFGTLHHTILLGELLAVDSVVDAATNLKIPADVVVIREYPGVAPERVKGRREAVFEKPRVQVVVRSKFYSPGRMKAERIYRFLDGFSGSVGGVGYARILALQSPTPIGRDDGDRFLFGFNAEVWKELSPLT